jgi:hypothetical protein
MTEWNNEPKQIETINGDRRNDRRYGIHLELRWKLIRRRRVLDSGVGHTIDLSSGGILFDPGRPLPVGLNAELAIAWPVLLRDVAPLQLIVSGRIVRCSQNRIAIVMVQHEFRTSGMTAEQRASMANNAARTPSVFLGNQPPFSAMKYR